MSKNNLAGVCARAYMRTGRNIYKMLFALAREERKIEQKYGKTNPKLAAEAEGRAKAYESIAFEAASRF